MDRRQTLTVAFCFALAVIPVCVSSCGAGTGGTSVPFQSGSPWPKFRAGAAQTGATTAHLATGGLSWSFATGKGIFSSPIVGADGTIFVGSADRYFYALNPDGTLKWKLLTGEIIDSAALLDDKGRVYFGSGDGHLRALDAKSGAVVWDTPADMPSKGAFINWFEGNVAMGPGGQLYVPNDNYFVYSFDRDSGSALWKTRMPDQTWSLPAVDEKTGNLFWGNNNLVAAFGSNLYASAPDGTGLWDSFVPATVAASPMLTPDGSMVVGGFDGYVRAYAQSTGAVRWEYGTRDHIYASPARLPDGTIVQASADGSVYGLDPASGALKWTFDRLAPIRGSPAIDGDGHIYFGAGDGRLYVLNADGTLRFSMLLIPGDRHDLNSSPALGKDAIYLGGESGEVFSVPYDYCLSAQGTADPRCAATDVLPASGALLYSVGPFGATSPKPPATIDPNQPLVFSFRLRTAGKTDLALLDSAGVTVQTTPQNDVRVEVSGDGKFLTILPVARFVPGNDGSLQFTVHAPYLVDLKRDGLKLSGGKSGGAADLAFTTAVNPDDTMPFALAAPQNAAGPATTWEVSRLALPLPTILPSYNQIGFDSLHYLVGVVEGPDLKGGPGVAWMAGAMLAAGENKTVIDPNTKALFPLDVRYQGGFLTLENTAGLSVEIMNATIPFRTFRIAVPLTHSGDSALPAHVTGSTVCAGIAIYGLFLEKLGLCNPQTDVLSVVGGSLFHPYQNGATLPPAGLGTVSFAATSKGVTATLAGTTLRAADHVYAVLLVDAATGHPVSLGYGIDTIRTSAGDLIQSVAIPFKSASVPSSVRAYLMVDTYPAAIMPLAIPGP